MGDRYSNGRITRKKPSRWPKRERVSILGSRWKRYVLKTRVTRRRMSMSSVDWKGVRVKFEREGRREMMDSRRVVRT